MCRVDGCRTARAAAFLAGGWLEEVEPKTVPLRTGTSGACARTLDLCHSAADSAQVPAATGLPVQVLCGSEWFKQKRSWSGLCAGTLPLQEAAGEVDTESVGTTEGLK